LHNSVTQRATYHYIQLCSEHKCQFNILQGAFGVLYFMPSCGFTTVSLYNVGLSNLLLKWKYF